MANFLTMDKVNAILALHKQNWSDSRIARELDIHRTTVAAHIKKFASKPTEAPIGSASSDAPCDLGRSDEQQGSSRSHCAPFQEQILRKLEHGLSAQRIYQDLVAEEGFQHSYDSVKRFVRKLTASDARPFRRLEVKPGQEAQVDFGQGAPIMADGKRRRPHVLRVVLSHSRKGYTEAIARQTTDGFIQCLENAFHHFGGAPETVVIDNLRAAVRRADWFDPELNPKVQSFAAHYQTAILPTRVATPRHKGKVERGVDYVQENALKGRVFDSLEQQNEYLRQWERTVADTRIHGTIREQVQAAFEAREQAALIALPADRFPCFQEQRRKVHRDGHVTVDKAYYSAPPEYLGREVWVRYDSHLVRIYNTKMEQIALHARQSAGKFSTHPEHITSEKISGVERGAAYWLAKTALIGPQTRDWAASMLNARGVQGVRVLMGLWQLSEKHSLQQVERACELALGYGAFRLQSIRQLIARPDAESQRSFDFLDEHPVIRPLSYYEEFVHEAFSFSFEKE